MRLGPEMAALSHWITGTAAALLVTAGTVLGMAGPLRAASDIVVDAMEYPWSAVGRVNAGGEKFCTGFLVGERQVMTAAHCLYDFVEGRWRAAGELHFIAGYQRDQYIIHSPVITYRRSGSYDVKSKPSLKTVLKDWAILTLAKPIGQQAGWVGLNGLSGADLEQVAAGEAMLLVASYTRARAHAMTASFNCRIASRKMKQRVITHACAVSDGQSGAPLLLYRGGVFYATGIHSINFDAKSGERRAGVLSLGIFKGGNGNGEAQASLRRSGVTWSQGQAPDIGSPASSKPLETLDKLLVRLGFLDSWKGGVSDDARRAAIASYQRANGLRGSQTPSLRLLAQLMLAAR